MWMLLSWTPQSLLGPLHMQFICWAISSLAFTLSKICSLFWTIFKYLFLWLSLRTGSETPLRLSKFFLCYKVTKFIMLLYNSSRSIIWRVVQCTKSRNPLGWILIPSPLPLCFLISKYGIDSNQICLKVSC